MSADMDGFEDSYYYGRRPCAVMLPNFRNVYKQETDFLRGYMMFYSAYRSGWGHPVPGHPIGEEFKKSTSEPGGWHISMMMQGETIPKEENHVRLSPDQKDEWDMPLV